MRANQVIFAMLSGFFGLMAFVYAGWCFIVYDGRVEWVGTVGLTLVSVMALFIGFYLNRSFRSQGGELPEDRGDASIDDGDPELGFYSPFSWWPIALASAAALGFLGIAVGVWISFIGGAIFLVAIIGWVYEYYRGFFAR
jgi:Ca2+/Na+ antiporter